MRHQTCSRCEHFSLKPLDERDTLVNHGYGHCRLIPRWQYQSQHAGCALAPSRFEAVG